MRGRTQVALQGVACCAVSRCMFLSARLCRLQAQTALLAAYNRTAAACTLLNAGADEGERMGNALAAMAQLQPVGTTLDTAHIKTKVSVKHC